MIAILDSGVANLTSVQAALDRLGAQSIITDDPKVLQNANRVILPGVGAAEAAMTSLKKKGLVEVIRALTCPVLGICLGMQLLFDRSEEGAECLGIIDGEVRQLRVLGDLPLPHMGWNQLEVLDAAHPLLNGIKTGDFVYYVHSFAAPVAGNTIAQTTYGTAFTAMVAKGNFMGCQFHPERSGETGSRILKNFIEMENA
ncbi:MAG TPA: imidazole glycerol phosphate synthase subunit HisH [Rhodospirillaceae bacterium]|nr:imidazole glycerol phosphate synthase subunit HisH [Rhodospirillaceae bacterium]